MQFTVGQTVVHPQHGPSTVTQLSHRVVKGVPRTYVETEVHQMTHRVSVPVDRAEEVGLRLPRTAAQLQELWDLLGQPTRHEEEQWSRRMKGNHERLRTGDFLVAAEVVRDLTRRLLARGLSSGEKDLLKQGRRPLVTELGLSLDLSEEEAERVLDAAINGEESLPGTDDLVTAC